MNTTLPASTTRRLQDALAAIGLAKVPLIAIAIALLTACATGPTHTARAPLPDEPHLTVMTFNVNYGRAHDPLTIAAVGAGDADIILLQETTPAWEENLREAFSEQYPHIAFHHDGGAGGLAVLSRYPLEHEIYPATDGWFPAMNLVAETPIGRVQCMSVHLHPPVSESGSVVSGYFSTGSVRRKEMQGYAARLDEALPTIVVGDFNEGEGDAINQMRDRGFALAVPMFQGEGVPTWRWNTSVGEVTSTLDHVMFKGIDAIDARVLNAGRSDHLPILVTFVRKADSDL